MSNLINADHLSLSLGNTPVLRDVSLHLERGQIYGLLGPNGAGKSTTIAVLTGLLRAGGGALEVLGLDPAREADTIRAGLGVLPEQNGFYDWMTGDDYLAFFAGLHRIEWTSGEMRDRLRAVGLAPRPGQTIGTYSRGMRQRLGLARALIGRPSLLILDEPTNGLDPRGRRDIHDLLIELATRDGVGVLLCTHLLDDVERLCGRISILVAGRTVAEGATADLTAAAGRQTRYRLRLAGGFDPRAASVHSVAVIAAEADWCVVQLMATVPAERAWRELLAAGWPVIEIRPEAGGLEDLYLALTEKEAT